MNAKLFSYYNTEKNKVFAQLYYYYCLIYNYRDRRRRIKWNSQS